MAQQNNSKIEFTCPVCKVTLLVAKEKAGMSGRCPKCGTNFNAPKEETVSRKPLVEKRTVSLTEPLNPHQTSPATELFKLVTTAIIIVSVFIYAIYNVPTVKNEQQTNQNVPVSIQGPVTSKLSIPSPYISTPVATPVAIPNEVKTENTQSVERSLIDVNSQIGRIERRLSDMDRMERNNNSILERSRYDDVKMQAATSNASMAISRIELRGELNGLYEKKRKLEQTKLRFRH